MRCHAPAPEFGRTELGLAYVDFDVPPGTAEGIARFYHEVMRAPASAAQGRATVGIGRDQRLHFTESGAPQPAYDNHHIQIYIADFSTPYEWLKSRDLISMETDADEWRFQWIVDPADARLNGTRQSASRRAPPGKPGNSGRNASNPSLMVPSRSTR